MSRSFIRTYLILKSDMSKLEAAHPFQNRHSLKTWYLLVTYNIQSFQRMQAVLRHSLHLGLNTCCAPNAVFLRLFFLLS